MESLWLLPLLILLFLLIVGQVFRFYLSFDVLSASGLVVVKFWFFKLKSFSFELKHNAVVIRTPKQTQCVEYAFNDPKLKFATDFSLEVKEKTKLKILDIQSVVGAGDAAQTASLSGLIVVFYKIFSAYIKNIKPTCTININNQTNFEKEIFHVKIFGKVSLSIFDFLYSLLFAWLKNT